MSVRWIIGLSVTAFLFMILSNILEGLFMTDSDTMTIWVAVASFKDISFADIFTLSGLEDIALGIGNLSRAIFNLISWNYSFFTGYFVIVRWFFIALSSAIFIHFMFELFRLVRRG